jgi:hypothetical protein
MINEIIRRLNDDPEIPLPPRCQSGMGRFDSPNSILAAMRPAYLRMWLEVPPAAGT